MPSVSKAQHNLMAMVAHNPAAAKRLGIPQKVGKEFTAADKGRKFSKGGETMDKKDLAQDKALIKKAFKQHDAQEHKGGKGTSLKLAKGGMTKMGAVKTAAPSRDGIAKKGKTVGKVVAMKRGGKC